MKKKTAVILLLIGVVYLVLTIIFLSTFCPRACVSGGPGEPVLCGCDLIDVGYVASLTLIYGIPGWILLILGIVFYIKSGKQA